MFKESAALFAAMSIGSCHATAQTLAPYENGTPSTLIERLHGLAEQGRERYADLQHRAMAKLTTASHYDTCQERKTRMTAVLPDAMALSRLSEIVYDSRADWMAARGLTESTSDDGRVAYQGNGGNWYAESEEFPAARKIAVVFRGTRASSRGDIGTDIANFVGVETPYYVWARGLAARLATTHRGWSVVTSGHSLGGGLALAAALALPNSKAIVFDPAGLPTRAWNAARLEDRQRMVADSSAFIAIGSGAMDAVSAGSVVGLSVIPARVYAIPVVDGGNPVERHSIAALRGGIQVAASSDNACAIDAGNLGIP